MANDTIALLNQPQPNAVGENDYQSFCATLGSSARGRAFLAEYAKRNRHADTEIVLAALHRLETVARSQKNSPDTERIRQDLYALLDTIRAARPQIDHSPGAIKAATLAALIDFVQARIEALLAPTRAPLAEVPQPEQPELPIPQPTAAAQPTMTLVHASAAPLSTADRKQTDTESDRVARAAGARQHLTASSHQPATGIIPEVNFIDSTPTTPRALPVSAPAQAKLPPTPVTQSIAAELPPAAPIAAPQSIDLPVPEPIELSQTEAIDSLALTETPAPQAEIAIAEISEFIEAAFPVAETAIVIETQTVIHTSIAAPVTPASEAAAVAPKIIVDPLAPIMTLSEHERMALFT